MTGEKWTGGRGSGVGDGNARNLDGTPYRGGGHGSGDAHTDRTPSQHKALARQAEADAAKPQPHVTLEAGEGMLRMINAQAARIDTIETTLVQRTEQQHALIESLVAGTLDMKKRITMLHDLIEQQQTGARGLAKRIDNLSQLRKADQDTSRRRGKGLHERIDMTRIAFEQFRNRAIAADPRLGEPTIQEQCDAVTFKGPKEEGDRE